MGKRIILDIEGLDASGKQTISNALMKQLDQPSTLISFPVYSTESGKKIKNYLAGEYGNPVDVGPKEAAKYYLQNRIEEFCSDRIDMVNDFEYYVFDRYVFSNVVYQSAKFLLRTGCTFDEVWDDNVLKMGFIKLVNDIMDDELNNGIPLPDAVFILTTPEEYSRELCKKRELETGVKRDAYELNSNYQKTCEDVLQNIYRIVSEIGYPVAVIYVETVYKVDDKYHFIDTNEVVSLILKSISELSAMNI